MHFSACCWLTKELFQLYEFLSTQNFVLKLMGLKTDGSETQQAYTQKTLFWIFVLKRDMCSTLIILPFMTILALFKLSFYRMLLYLHSGKKYFFQISVV